MNLREAPIFVDEGYSQSEIPFAQPAPGKFPESLYTSNNNPRESYLPLQLSLVVTFAGRTSSTSVASKIRPVLSRVLLVFSYHARAVAFQKLENRPIQPFDNDLTPGPAEEEEKIVRRNSPPKELSFAEDENRRPDRVVVLASTPEEPTTAAPRTPETKRPNPLKQFQEEDERRHAGCKKLSHVSQSVGYPLLLVQSAGLPFDAQKSLLKAYPPET